MNKIDDQKNVSSSKLDSITLRARMPDRPHSHRTTSPLFLGPGLSRRQSGVPVCSCSEEAGLSKL